MRDLLTSHRLQDGVPDRTALWSHDLPQLPAERARTPPKRLAAGYRRPVAAGDNQVSYLQKRCQAQYHAMGLADLNGQQQAEGRQEVCLRAPSS